MATAYYRRLNRSGRAAFRASDRLDRVDLGDASGFWPLVEALQRALGAEDASALRHSAQGLADAVTRRLAIPALHVQVLAVRPSSSRGELHGLYEQRPGHPARIRIWMRTAKAARVVAFKTFLRTLVHEFVHHLDYHHFKLADSLHTPGFFKRESSLVRQLTPGAVPGTARPQAPTVTRSRGEAALALLRAALIPKPEA